MLFDINEIKNMARDTSVDAGAVRISATSRMAEVKGTRRLSESIGKVIPGECIHFYTKGAWSLHSLLFYIIAQTGPAKVWFTTWAISELAVRMLLAKLQSSEITELYAILDTRIKSRRPEVLQFASMGMSRIALAELHAKIVVIENAEWNITITTSANMTRNKRMEAGVISTDKMVADFNKQWIMNEIDNAGTKI